MLEAMLEPQMKNAAGATQTQVGWTFLISGAVYMFSSPIVGFVSYAINPLFEVPFGLNKSFNT